MVALHGLYRTPRRIMRYRGLTDRAEKSGFVVVAPMGYNNRGWYGIEFFNKHKKPANADMAPPPAAPAMIIRHIPSIK